MVKKIRKFDVIVGNPPYQKDDKGVNIVSKSPLYHLFMNVAQTIGTKVSLIYPSRFLQGGKGLDEFRKVEKFSKHYHSFYDNSESKKFFPEVQITGGVCFFLWDKNKTDGTVNYFYDEILEVRENLNGTFGVRDTRVNEVLKKIYSEKNMFKDGFVAASRIYGREVENYEKTLRKAKSGTGVYVYAVDQGVGIKKVEVDYDSGYDLNDWKVGVTRLCGAGVYEKRRLNRIMVAEPNTMLSGSLIKVGSFQTEQEAVNLLRYLKTDFVSFLLSLALISNDVSRKSFYLIPTVDFKTGEILSKPGCFLNFNEPETLDEQLFKFYDLTENEIKIVQKGLRPWKNKVDVKADE